MQLRPVQRLVRIAEIIEAVSNRCMASDGPESPTLQEMTPAELSEIYKLAKGEHVVRNPNKTSWVKYI